MNDNGRLLELALKGLEAERLKLDEEMTELTSQMRRHVMPTFSASQTASSLRSRTRANGTKQHHTVKRKGGISPEGRRKLSEAAKRRWQKSKKLGKTTL
jgi:hypothetical protein